MIANLSGNGTFVLDCVAQCPPSIIQQKSHHDMIIKPESNPKKSPKCLGTRSSRRMLHPNANSSSP